MSPSSQHNAINPIPSTSMPPILPIPSRPLLPYTDDSPFFRHLHSTYAQRIISFSTRLKKILSRTKDFTTLLMKLSDGANALAQELLVPWGDVEGALSGLIWSSLPDHNIQHDELVSLSSSMGKLGTMVQALSEMLIHLVRSFEQFMINPIEALRVGEMKDYEGERDKMSRYMNELDTNINKKLNRKRAAGTHGNTAVGLNSSQPKKTQYLDKTEIQEMEQLLHLRSQYELARFNTITACNSLLVEKRLELIEMLCASFAGFVSFMHEGSYMAETLKEQVNQITKAIYYKRMNFAEQDKLRSDERKAIESQFLITYPLDTCYAVAMNWRPSHTFTVPVSAQLQPHLSLLSYPPQCAMLRGKPVKVEYEGYLRKQSSNLKKDWKRRW